MLTHCDEAIIFDNISEITPNLCFEAHNAEFIIITDNIAVWTLTRGTKCTSHRSYLYNRHAHISQIHTELMGVDVI